MRAILIVMLIWVLAVLIAQGMTLLVASVANTEVEKWGEDYQAAIDKEFPGE